MLATIFTVFDEIWTSQAEPWTYKMRITEGLGVKEKEEVLSHRYARYRERLRVDRSDMRAKAIQSRRDPSRMPRAKS